MTTRLGDILLDDACKSCGGKGRTTNPEWLEWDNQRRQAKASFSGWLVEHPFPDSAEQLTCTECKGLGMMLTEDGQALLAFFERYEGRVP